MTKSVPPSLDSNGFYPFRLDRDRLRLDLAASISPHFPIHLNRLLKLTVDGKPIPLMEGEAGLQWSLPPGDALLELTIRRQPVAAFARHGDALEPTSAHSLYQLSVAETRTLGLAVEISEVPYARSARKGFNPALHAPLTDVHTHASAQISADDLLAIASEANVAYPVALLEKLGMGPEKNQATIDMPSFEFTPLREEGLLCEQGNGALCKGISVAALNVRQRASIIAQMRVGGDTTLLLSDFERTLYRYRNPLVKNPALTKAMLRKIADDYVEQGISYAELSTGSMMNPSWFRAMAEAIEEIEHEKNITIRFLVGLPRNISPQETLITLKKIQYLAQHPFIVGVDLLGYEINKTSDFQWALAHLAQWALQSSGGWHFARDFTLRIHAGETGKNPENVRDAMAIARDYGVRVRVAHALRATIDKKTAAELKSLNIKDDRFAFEMCPDSNQVYMNNMLVHTSPLKERFRHAPMFLGTDGAGALATTPRQLAFSALAAGLTLKDLAVLRATERGFIERQRARETEKRKTYDAHYKNLDAFLEGYEAELKKIPRDKAALLHYLPASFAGKTPLLIAGASGSSWNELNDADRRTIRQVMQLLVRVADPSKIYFVLGRVQKEGVSRALDIAVREHNKRHPEQRFDVLGRFAGAEQYPTGELAESISWVQNITGGRDAVPGSMLDFLEAHKGHALFCGGTAFTAEMAKGAAIFRNIPHALMVPASGILADTARILPPEFHFKNLDGFLALLKTSGLTQFLRPRADLSRAKKDAILAAKTGQEDKS